MADFDGGAEFHRAGIGLQRSRDHVQEGGLARAVASDDADPVIPEEVIGEVVDDGDFQGINLRYDDVHNITKVDKKDFGSLSMQHWEVGGA